MAGLDTLPDGVTIARLVRDVLGAEPRGARPLGAGVATFAWRVETEGEAVVVLVEKPAAARPAAIEGIADIAPRFGSQCAILDALHPLDERVPRAIAWSSDPEHRDAARFDLPWAMMSEARGAPAAPEELRADGARDLGELLARLHALPCEGFGLTADRRDSLVGGAPGMVAGLLERWPGLWPFDGTSLIAHPLARLAPRLIEPASRFREALLRFGELRRGVVLHSDLNPEHLFLDAGRTQMSELPLAARVGFAEVVAGIDGKQARYEADRCLSCGNCFECDNCFAACPEQAIVKLGKGRKYRVNLDLCTGCAVCFDQCPCHAIEMVGEAEAAEGPVGSLGETLAPHRFKLRP